MSKKNKGRNGKHLFRVAISGKTIDGRVIPANHIEEMAANYDPEHYQARIWLEHLKAVWPDSDFVSHGDVLSLEAHEVEVGGEMVMGLYAELSPGDKLMEFSRKGIKVFTSIEYIPNFREKGYAYMTGLAATDTPASAGTERLEFSMSKDQSAIQTECIEMSANPEPQADPETKEESKISLAFTQFADSIKQLFGKKENDDAEMIASSLSDITDLLKADAEERAAFSVKFEAQESKIESLKTELSELKEKLASEPKSHTYTPNVHLTDPENLGIEKTDY